ncbi:hypothetical protein TVAG_402480 [Trichomonas vaginalis G3]|uniref:BTB domain-containing protein n=1 Tax=Trichomonas vaginalis (strain ATCC PRA-98 / G3) TaxID=412133 RepID=A2DI04_TRIV3|nr:hypothetical protein TVAGG3_0272080 [Trichomonas vaginalis G3]EAY19993.1 hypothetical protein TVAG_402480 [Trichomonas vaginalis G3]KAI5525944.1 hypothetical protein TVAGG3_0272080 [Trichomonas vaginalis G3]|eukprot:XP_001580979.1 hypothetical protein [Trichomonas vaginalis G3]
MEVVQLIIEDENVLKLRGLQNIEPTFEIRHEGKSYPCNPIPAVESAHLIFEGFVNTKALGFIELHNEDKKHLLPSIISFLHGNTLRIEQSNAMDMKDIAQELGIPLIEEYARNCIFSDMSNQQQMDREYEATFTVDIN